MQKDHQQNSRAPKKTKIVSFLNLILPCKQNCGHYAILYTTNTLYHRLTPWYPGYFKVTDVVESGFGEFAIGGSPDCLPNAGPTSANMWPYAVLTLNHPSGVQTVCLGLLKILNNVDKTIFLNLNYKKWSHDLRDTLFHRQLLYQNWRHHMEPL